MVSVSSASTLKMSDTLRSSRRRIVCKEQETEAWTDETPDDEEEADNTRASNANTNGGGSGITGGFAKVQKLTSRWLNGLFGMNQQQRDANREDEEEVKEEVAVKLVVQRSLTHLLTTTNTFECDNYNSNAEDSLLLINVAGAIPSSANTETFFSRGHNNCKDKDIKDGREDELATGGGQMDNDQDEEANYLNLKKGVEEEDIKREKQCSRSSGNWWVSSRHNDEEGGRTRNSRTCNKQKQAKKKTKKTVSPGNYNCDNYHSSANLASKDTRDRHEDGDNDCCNYNGPVTTRTGTGLGLGTSPTVEQALLMMIKSNSSSSLSLHPSHPSHCYPPQPSTDDEDDDHPLHLRHQRRRRHHQTPRPSSHHQKLRRHRDYENCHYYYEKEENERRLLAGFYCEERELGLGQKRDKELKLGQNNQWLGLTTTGPAPASTSITRPTMASTTAGRKYRDMGKPSREINECDEQNNQHHQSGSSSRRGVVGKHHFGYNNNHHYNGNGDNSRCRNTRTPSNANMLDCDNNGTGADAAAASSGGNNKDGWCNDDGKGDLYYYSRDEVTAKLYNNNHINSPADRTSGSGRDKVQQGVVGGGTGGQMRRDEKKGNKTQPRKSDNCKNKRDIFDRLLGSVANDNTAGSVYLSMLESSELDNMADKHNYCYGDENGDDDGNAMRLMTTTVDREELQYFINKNINNNNINQRDQVEGEDDELEVSEGAKGLIRGSTSASEGVGHWFSFVRRDRGQNNKKARSGDDGNNNKKFYYSKIAIQE